MPEKHILLIEDNLAFLEKWRLTLEAEDYIVQTAESVEAARKVFPEQQWDAIVFDGCIGGDTYNSEPLIREFKTKTKPECIFVAATRNPDLAQLMIQAGCTRAADKKEYVPGVIHSLLQHKHTT